MFKNLPYSLHLKFFELISVSRLLMKPCQILIDTFPKMLYSFTGKSMDAKSSDEALLLKALRARDEEAFTWLVEKYHASFVRLARIFVHDSDIAEEVAQDTWLAVLRGLERFEGRSSLKTWLYTILTNKAKSRHQKERHTVTYTDLEDAASNSPTVDPGRFNDSSSNQENHWAPGMNPVSWEGIPEEKLLAQENSILIARAIDELPQNQRIVITLRDINELSSEEVCNVLGISETNQRVLLHRARARVRQTLETHLQPEV